ncbi:unnamed protein product [Cryptosporidium hominis]|uniref:Polyketide cyclase / dehydrase/lipid transport /Coenzyme Q-binding protein COQ10/START domain containing protein n=1 Tax=Cryptosporidium hominis TaxID=237895 RepID=A0A0S4TIL1_CRYHO|nr:hypothetical protein [Cryptosporidium hominis TU502]OLQ17867.1 hypothetical protein ChTU502y2012_407g0975 [Cryptosporidium hominis]PPA64173.1 Polyketide cyclase / dehydrase and lipid transport family protein [Cryptosporidium hominis]PPS94716.1 Polyketide cyclase / dehydrase/lipid transport /Coenzyme Q-binding protein COQ10/START domain containing protein [Cryptosporidium hominis]CUV07178.1 unnamed protein product [Cryptosporidium hominis]|eukprot:PPS94716.1 Polyketide cyclase / dehydrase/lipid transport /Coenzyme Q-binding protein COQ10/START domain containing protein [Cryptosporidium hominis]
MLTKKLNRNFFNQSKFSRGIVYFCERLVPYSVPELYSTVIDVTKYRQIFPWISETEITKIWGSIHNRDIFFSKQKIKFGIFGGYLYSIVVGRKPNSIIAYWPPNEALKIPTAIEKFPSFVRSHRTSWEFIGNYKYGLTKVSCKLEFEFDTILMNKIAQRYIKDMTETTINTLIDHIKKSKSLNTYSLNI